MVNDSIFMGKMMYNPLWMSHMGCQTHVQCIVETSQRKPYFYKVKCTVLFLLLLSHPDAVLLGTMKIQKFTGKWPNVFCL